MSQYLNIAIDLARASRETAGGVRMAAVVTYKSQIVGVGINSYKTHPMMARLQMAHNPERIYLHAEVAALLDAHRRVGLKRLPRCLLWVARVQWDGQVALAKPCAGCRKAIERFGLKRVYYTVQQASWALDRPC